MAIHINVTFDNLTTSDEQMALAVHTPAITDVIVRSTNNSHEIYCWHASGDAGRRLFTLVRHTTSEAVAHGALGDYKKLDHDSWERELTFRRGVAAVPPEIVAEFRSRYAR